MGHIRIAQWVKWVSKCDPLSTLIMTDKNMKTLSEGFIANDTFYFDYVFTLCT